MIDVLKRLQELDANNSNVIKESTVEECGPMGMMPSQPKTPATINITADSGEELGSMLSAIMKLAGVNKVEPSHLGVEHEPSVISATPSLGVGPSTSDSEVMRGVIDKMNPEVDGDELHRSGEEETDEADSHSAEFDNTPNDPRDTPSFDANEYSAHPNDGDGNDKQGKPRTMAQPAALEDRLMADYKKFISEDWRDEVSGGSDFAFGVHNPNDARMTSPRGTGISAGGLGGGDDEEGDVEKPQVKKKEEAPIVGKVELNSELVNHAIKKFGPLVAKRNGWQQNEKGDWFFPVRQGMKGEKLDSLLLHMNTTYGKPGHPLVVGSKDMDVT